MDFFNLLASLFNGPYTHQHIYPPLPFLFYKIMLRFVPYDIVSKGAFAIRASQSGEVVFLFYTLITLFSFFVLLTNFKKGKQPENIFFILLMLFSGPFLFQFERANIILVALLFLMLFIFLEDSKNKIIREVSLICLSVAVAIKIYPIIFIGPLIAERRFKETLRILIYSFVLLVFPFFLIGGLDSIRLFFKNLAFASDFLPSLGLGYSVSVQNITRIIFAFFGDFSKIPNILGRIISYLVLLVGFFSSFFLTSKWKKVTLLSSLMILFPIISYQYTLIFMTTPLILFLDKKEELKSDYFYSICFLLIFIPFSLYNIDFINKHFLLHSYPLSYGLLIQNMTLLVLTVVIVTEGMRQQKAKETLSIIWNYICNIFVKIYGSKLKGATGDFVIFVKILLTIIFLIIIFGEQVFSMFYLNFWKSNLRLPKDVVRKSIPYITAIEPYYVHPGDKVIVKGVNFNWRLNKPVSFESNYGDINPEFWSNEEFIFSVPLSWRVGKVEVWVDKPISGKLNIKSNMQEISVLDRLGNFGEDDVEYYSQIKYLSDETRDLNNFQNYKLRNYKYTRWIPNYFFQLYSDLVSLKNYIFK